jgi:DNA polymerase I-like protein with 3'-5' exonuclease and polymerase domains
MEFMDHPIQMDKKKDGTRKPTTNEKALNILIRKFPKDPVYPAVLKRREIEKIGGTYIGWWDEEKQEVVGGMPIGEDGLMHTTFSYDASTLRFTSSGPNLQNIPRVA